MALIKCPECGKEVSDKSNVCIGCGYPLHQNNSIPSSIDENQLKSFIQQGEMQSIRYIRSAGGYNLNEAKEILRKYMTKNNLKFNMTPQVQLQHRTTYSDICPKCGSSSITTTARGVNALWGFIGASKTVNRCSKCGHTWTPRG